MVKIMGGGPKRRSKDIPTMTPKGVGGPGGRPEYEQLKKCPDSFEVKLQLVGLAKQPREGEALSLSVVSEKEIKVMKGAFPVGNLSEKQAKSIFRCINLGMKYRGVFRKQKIKGKSQAYAEFKRIAR